MRCEAEEFIETLTQHISEKGFRMIRYHLLRSSEKHLWSGFPTVPTLQGSDDLCWHHPGEAEAGPVQTPYGISIGETHCLMTPSLRLKAGITEKYGNKSGFFRYFNWSVRSKYSGTVQE